MWAALAIILLLSGALLLPACGIVIGSWRVSWCGAEAGLGALNPLITQLDQLERAVAQREPCAVQAERPAPPVTKPGDVLTLPQESKDLKFLEGCWESSSPIFETNTKEPLQEKFCFAGTEGRGTRTIKFKSKNVTCQVDLIGKRVGMNLEMTSERAPCTNGTHFPPSVITCRSGAEGTRCDIVEYFDGKPEAADQQVRGATFKRVD